MLDLSVEQNDSRGKHQRHNLHIISRIAAAAKPENIKARLEPEASDFRLVCPRSASAEK